MTNGNVLGFLAAPDRDISVRAISLALLKVRALEGMTCDKLGAALDCSADTIRAASNEETQLSFTSVARLLYFFPKETGVIAELWGRAAEAPTVTDRLNTIQAEMEALRKTLAA